ncbi:hypothetical protein A5671_07620 [Mycolicibacter heraklionensis]|nr:hypothetical protein A5671_07620 [Mycolicibacter heraklionensis]
MLGQENRYRLGLTRRLQSAVVAELSRPISVLDAAARTPAVVGLGGAGFAHHPRDRRMALCVPAVGGIPGVELCGRRWSQFLDSIGQVPDR